MLHTLLLYCLLLSVVVRDGGGVEKMQGWPKVVNTVLFLILHRNLFPPYTFTPPKDNVLTVQLLLLDSHLFLLVTFLPRVVMVQYPARVDAVVYIRMRIIALSVYLYSLCVLQTAWSNTLNTT